MHHRPVRSDEGEGIVCLAVPGQIVDLVDESIGLATIEIAGVKRKVNVGLIDDASAGDWVLVHVGFAIARVDEAEAQATLALLQEMGAEYETELEELKASAIE
jgi:hydrogenase expression/formation protein HypC